MIVGAIVAAAGAGTRLGMGSKSLVQLGGRTALARVARLFLDHEEVDRIVVVGPPDRMEMARHEIEALRPAKPVLVCPGGDTRQLSVRTGLAHLEGCDFVLVHDAARPMVTSALVGRVLAAAVQAGAAIPGVRPRDAIKRVEGGRLVENLDRSRVVLAQTPQAFRFQLLERAHFEAADSGLVGDDDAQLVAASGHEVAVVEGEPTNIRLTTVEDLALLEGLLRERDRSGAAPAEEPPG